METPVTPFSASGGPMATDLSAPAPPPHIPNRKPTFLEEVRRHWADYIYVLPAIAVMVLVIGYPIVYTIWLSFHETQRRTGINVWNGLGSYRDVLTDDLFWKATKNTFIWTVGSTLG
ncbi:MAG TPA: hypothetical protein PK691_03840, partial [Thermomicrobiales bacterium]|nr:hypothetical protein [Thermomicrobiales bacterium]